MDDRRQVGTGTLAILPDHVISHIFSLFSYKELINVSSVSAAFYVFCNDEALWQDIFLHGTDSTFHFDGSWKYATLLKLTKAPSLLTLPKPLHFDGVHFFFQYQY